ncbi:hypothetical protein ONS95_010262 [Cadophora gregata]|uniref:uncharacterized protein n=1 Tax=Cadophora gregata TaxID=51156 RepID=UPI0026DC9EF2|nr:uncharacterized protein ONS95_010262 [Cadophora gregata]KAK0121993.1 hypothetical protein ONS95_010262 [Cadophora gregata]KAK0127473.1 hypothetical protein ONS96_007009 [Cadophora gregata f. sp. sojae]
MASISHKPVGGENAKCKVSTAAVAFGAASHPILAGTLFSPSKMTSSRYDQKWSFLLQHDLDLRPETSTLILIVHQFPCHRILLHMFSDSLELFHSSSFANYRGIARKL